MSGTTGCDARYTELGALQISNASPLLSPPPYDSNVPFPSLPLFPYLGLSGEFSREALYAAKSDFERVVKACPIVSPACVWFACLRSLLSPGGEPYAFRTVFF